MKLAISKETCMHCFKLYCCLTMVIMCQHVEKDIVSHWQWEDILKQVLERAWDSVPTTLKYVGVLLQPEATGLYFLAQARINRLDLESEKAQRTAYKNWSIWCGTQVLVLFGGLVMTSQSGVLMGLLMMLLAFVVATTYCEDYELFMEDEQVNQFHEIISEARKYSEDKQK